MQEPEAHPLKFISPLWFSAAEAPLADSPTMVRSMLCIVSADRYSILILISSYFKFSNNYNVLVNVYYGKNILQKVLKYGNNCGNMNLNPLTVHLQKRVPFCKTRPLPQVSFFVNLRLVAEG